MGPEVASPRRVVRRTQGSALGCRRSAQGNRAPRAKRFSWTWFERALKPFWDSKSESIPAWDDYFHALALVASVRSKDEQRKVGAVVVAPDMVVLSTGFNGFPRGVKDLPERWHVQDEKLRWVSHAEPLAMPRDDRRGLHEYQCAAPVWPQARECDPESAIDPRKLRSLRAPSEHRELLS